MPDYQVKELISEAIKFYSDVARRQKPNYKDLDQHRYNMDMVRDSLLGCDREAMLGYKICAEALIRDECQEELNEMERRQVEELRAQKRRLEALSPKSMGPQLQPQEESLNDTGVKKRGPGRPRIENPKRKRQQSDSKGPPPDNSKGLPPDQGSGAVP